MKHPVLDCAVQPEHGVEAHYERIEADLLNKKVELLKVVKDGAEKYPVEFIAELMVDIELLEIHLGQTDAQI